MNHDVSNTHESSLLRLQDMLNSSNLPLYALGLPMQKGIVGRQKQYKFVVYSNDHLPPHMHITLNNNPIAKYDLVTGECIASRSKGFSRLVEEWLVEEENRERALQEWARLHGPLK